MSEFLNLPNGNRYYFRFPDSLPTNNWRVKMKFTLHHSEWELLLGFFNDKDESLKILIRNITQDNKLIHNLEVRCGILKGCGTELVALSILPIEMRNKIYFPLKKIISCSELEQYMKENKALHFFIEMKRSDEIKAEKMESRKYASCTFIKGWDFIMGM